MTPGRKLLVTTEHCSSKSRKIGRDRSSLMLSAKDFLFALREAKYPDESRLVTPGRDGGDKRKLSGRRCDSILMTSAPCSASICVTSEPAPTQQKSSTLTSERSRRT